MFAIVDVETTGGHAAGHRMTEIAIVIHDGERIGKSYSRLLNPGQSIPLAIQSLTGITPDMLADAPTFAEIATEVRDFLGDHIFVAHNVNFDYAFVKNAFAQAGIQYHPRRLCSLRYARKMVPGLRSYALRNLCRHFGVTNQAAHRAGGDALATAQILDILLRQDSDRIWHQWTRKNSGTLNLPAHLPVEEFEGLPRTPGVYYFLGKDQRPLYIGKARDLRQRVAGHFTADKTTKRSQAFKRDIHRIRYQLTGCEPVAALLEDHEIRHYWPLHNRAQKKKPRQFSVYAYQNQAGWWCLAINRTGKSGAGVRQFFSHLDATGWLYRQIQEYDLNGRYCGFPTWSEGPEIREEHNQHLREFLMRESDPEDNMLLLTPGRQEGEQGFVYLEQGRLAGMGFSGAGEEDPAKIRQALQPLRHSPVTMSILRNMLEDERYEQKLYPGRLTAKPAAGLLLFE